MNKKDIKNSIECIKTDDFMKTRLKAAVDASSHRSTTTRRRSSINTIAASVALLALGVGVGTCMHMSDNNVINLSTNHANAENERYDATDYAPEATERTIYSQDEIEADLGYTIPDVQADPNNSSVAVSETFTPPVITDTRLIVMGKDISEGNHIHFFRTKNYVELPFTAIISELADVDIIWISDTMAKILIDDTSYTLNIDDQCSLVKDGTAENIFTPSPYVGDAPFYKMVDGELIIDNTTLAGFINHLGHVMIIDYDTKTVTIV